MTIWRRLSAVALLVMALSLLLAWSHHTSPTQIGQDREVASLNVADHDPGSCEVGATCSPVALVSRAHGASISLTSSVAEHDANEERWRHLHHPTREPPPPRLPA